MSFTSPTAITHGVDVEAETLYEAQAWGSRIRRKDGWIEGLGQGPGSRLRFASPITPHSLTINQLQRWINGVPTGPAEVLRRAKLKQMLGS